jgi:hypothetical protein
MYIPPKGITLELSKSTVLYDKMNTSYLGD